MLLFHKHRPWRKLLFQILSLFFFWSFFIKITWVLHELGALCLHKFISAECFCFLRFFQLIYIFQSFNNIPFELQSIMFFGYLVKDTSQTMSFQKFFWTVLYLFNWGDQGSNKIGTYSSRRICFHRLAGHLVNVFFVDSVFFHLGDRTFKWNYACLQRLRAYPANCSLFYLFLSGIKNNSMELCIFDCVRGCPYSCFHGYFFPGPSVYYWRQLPWLSCDH